MIQLSSVTIRIDDEEISGFINLDITQDIYSLSEFEISFDVDGIENPGDFIVERSKNFIGKICSIISEGEEFNSDSTGEGFSFRGIVTKISSNKSRMSSGDLLVIHGYSPEVILKGKPTCRSFKDKTIEQIVNEVLQPYPVNLLNPNISPRNSDQLTYVVQYMESDYDFLRRLSIRYGEWFFYSGQELFFGEIPDIDEIDLRIGLELESFNFDLMAAPSGNALRYVNDIEKEICSWESGRNNVEQQLNEYGQHTYSESNDLYTEQAKRTYNHLNIDPANYQEGLEKAGELEEIADILKHNDIKAAGRSLLVKIGQVTNILYSDENHSNQNCGSYRLTKISHFADHAMNYNNTLDGMNSECDIPENTNPNAIRKSGPIRGQVRENVDPDKYGRVIVDYGWVAGEDDTTPWIRVMSPYVMHQGGNFFVPEVGSDVMVAFEDNDMERPYVMGAFNTSPNQFCPDPAWGDETPNIKAIRTISGHTIELHDVEGSEKIRIYDKDEISEITFDTANNELKIFSTESLKIEAREIEITAEESIKIEAGQGMEIEAGQDLEISGQSIDASGTNDVNLEGMNVEISANAQFKASGSAGSELTSPAILTLRGSMVNIN